MVEDLANNATEQIPYWSVGNVTKEQEKHYDESKENYMYGIAFICCTMFAGIIFRECLNKLNFPYTALLFLFGCMLGLIDHHFEKFRVFTELARVDSRLMMHLFLPAIIYESAFSLDTHMFFMALSQCLVLAGPGVILCSVLIGVFAKYVLAAYEWDWIVCFIFGAILSATDPVAVVALLKECGISASLTTIIEGESLLNDGAAIVIFDSLLTVYESGEFSMAHIVYEFFYNVGVSVAVSYLISLGTIALLRRIELDTDIEVTFTFCIAYLTYYTSEISLGVSGVLSVTILGVAISNYKSNINYEQEEETTMHQFWQTLSFWSNTLIFTRVGIIIATKNHPHFQGGDIAFIVATYVAVSVFRALMIALFSPLLKNMGYGFTWNYAAVLTWGGLRGAVGLALVLISQETLPPKVATQLLKQVSGIIFLTLVFNASTMKILLTLLGVGRVTEKNKKDMQHAVDLLRDAVSLAEKVTRMDKHLVGVDWMWVRQVTHIHNPYENIQNPCGGQNVTFDQDRGQCPKCEEDIKIAPNEEEVKALEEDARLKVLRAFECSVWNQHNSFGVSRRTLRHLSTSIENAIDEPGKYVSAGKLSRKFLSISKFSRFMKKLMMRILDRLKIENRQSAGELYLRNRKRELVGFEKWCLSIYLSPRFEVVLYWILLLNIIPIAGMITSLLTPDHSKEAFEKEVVIFEAINGIFALVYVFDAFVAFNVSAMSGSADVKTVFLLPGATQISGRNTAGLFDWVFIKMIAYQQKVGSLGWKEYLNSHGNKVDFLVTITAVLQLIIDIVILAAYRDTYSTIIIKVLVIMSSIRLIRLLRIMLSGIFRNIMNEVCSIIYNAYDLAVGFVVANEKIAREAATILEYEPSADLAQFNAENNIAQALSIMQDLDNEFPDVTHTWKTQRATVYVLRDMKRVVEEMLAIYMLDESDSEILLEELALKIKETLCAPRYMQVDTGRRKLMENLLWIKNERLLDMFYENCTYSSFDRDEVIQEAGTKPRDLRIIYKGIVQVSGQNDGVKDKALPNTDSLWYFVKNGSFCEYLSASESIGILGYLLRSNCVTTATCTKDAELIHIRYETLQQAEKELGELSFYMWRPISIQIAQTILEKEQNYEYWTEERIRIHLEEGIFPDLQEVEDFEVHEAIADMVLIQGRVMDSNTDTVYVGPTYIPRTVRSLTMMDYLKYQPRVVMILLREEKYHSPTIMGWIDSHNITHKGLCLVHGIRRASITGEEQLHEVIGRHHPSFVQTLGNLLSKAEDRKMLQHDVP